MGQSENSIHIGLASQAEEVCSLQAKLACWFVFGLFWNMDRANPTLSFYFVD